MNTENNTPSYKDTRIAALRMEAKDPELTHEQRATAQEKLDKYEKDALDSKQDELKNEVNENLVKFKESLNKLDFFSINDLLNMMDAGNRIAESLPDELLSIYGKLLDGIKHFEDMYSQVNELVESRYTELLEAEIRGLLKRGNSIESVIVMYEMSENKQQQAKNLAESYSKRREKLMKDVAYLRKNGESLKSDLNGFVETINNLPPNSEAACELFGFIRNKEGAIWAGTGDYNISRLYNPFETLEILARKASGQADTTYLKEILNHSSALSQISISIEADLDMLNDEDKVILTDIYSKYAEFAEAILQVAEDKLREHSELSDAA